MEDVITEVYIYSDDTGWHVQLNNGEFLRYSAGPYSGCFEAWQAGVTWMEQAKVRCVEGPSVKRR